MSRIGNQPVALPDGVSIKLGGGAIEVKGPKGSLKQSLPTAIAIDVADDRVRFKRPDDSTKTRALHGLVRALVNNMVQGA